jgi:hypothetical protein
MSDNKMFFDTILAKAKELGYKTVLEAVLWYRKNRNIYRYNFVLESFVTLSATPCANNNTITKEKTTKAAETSNENQPSPEIYPVARLISHFPTNEKQITDQDNALKIFIKYISERIVEPLPQTYTASENDPPDSFASLNYIFIPKTALALTILTLSPA